MDEKSINCFYCWDLKRLIKIVKSSNFKLRYNKALVTGGAGFTGSHIVEEFVNMGVETISIDNYFAWEKI
jgi:hypothetical protein